MEQLDIYEFNLRHNENDDDVEKTEVDINFHKLLKKEIENDIEKVSKKEDGTFKSFTIKQETCPKLDTTQEHEQSLELRLYFKNCVPNYLPQLVNDECVSFKTEHQEEEICLSANIEGEILPSYLKDALHASVHSLEEITDISSLELFKAESTSDSNSYTKDDQCQYRLNASEQFHPVVNQLNENYSLDEGQRGNKRDNCYQTGENNYKCDICNAAFTKYSSLENHLITHCRGRPGQTTLPCAQTTKEHHCDFYVRTSTKCPDLNAHQKLKTIEEADHYKCNICLFEFDKKDTLDLHGRLHIKEKPYKCRICSTTFAKKSYLNKHQSVHTGERPYKCDQSHNCSAAFATNYDLQLHTSLHSEQKPFQCDQCSAAFGFIKKLIRHQRIHSADKPYKCNICPAAYACKSGLTYHLKTHTGEKPFNCDICSQAFAIRSRLARHQRMHTGEKPYQCAVCLSSHASKYHLTRHQAIHRPIEEKLKLKEKLKNQLKDQPQEKQHKCHFCSSAFALKSTLVQHERLHTGERPYKCSICPAAFACKSNLVSHKKAHTGDKPYRCNMCKVSYAKKGNFKVHQRNHVTTS